VARHRVLTDRFLDFLADVRPAFLLLQTAICRGLTDAALAAAEPKHVGTGTTFRSDHAALSARRDDLAAEHVERLERESPADADLIRLRLEASELAVAATRHEAAVTGGAGYLAASATARRLREAAFLPIQSPTEAQLRWELSRSA
jgi:alkylation response protein AidB-like acyl-CoA dehydrogenase